MPKKKKKYAAIKGYAAVSVLGVVGLAVIGFGAIVAAQTYGTTITNSNVSIDQSGSDATFGQIASEEPTRRSGFIDLNVTGSLTFGDEDRRTDGFTQGFKVIDLNATTTATELNDTDETIYVYDAYVRVQTATTTAIAYRVGTTTASVFGNDEQCGIDGTCSATTAGDASILDTDTAAATTVGNTYFKVDFAGTDTGYLGTTVVPVADGEYISAYASTSPAANLQAGGQAAQIVVKYYILND